MGSHEAFSQTWFHLEKTVIPGTLLNRPDLRALNETKRDATIVSQKDPRSGGKQSNEYNPSGD